MTTSCAAMVKWFTLLLLCSVMLDTVYASPVRHDDAFRAFKSAQCRAMCLDEYKVGSQAAHTKCLKNQHCFTCWEKCSSFSLEHTSSENNCQHIPDCESDGCQLACEFHRSAVDHATRQQATLTDSAAVGLEVRFGWSEVSWRMTRPGLTDDPDSVVYLLLAKTNGLWKELVQTPEAGVVLINLPAGTALRLSALTSAGQLGVVDTVYAPVSIAEDDNHQQIQQPLVLDIQQDEVIDGGRRTDLVTYQIEVPGAWLLETVSVSRDSQMALAEISWQPQTTSEVAQYLVTWEVSGGGITGHLYTDLTQVTLSLWPEAVYNIQVELMTAGDGDEPYRSVPLVISTHTAAVPYQTLRDVRTVNLSQVAELAVSRADVLLEGSPLAVLALMAVAVCPAVICGLYVLAVRRCRWQRRHHGACAGSGAAHAHSSVFLVAPRLKQKLVQPPCDITPSSQSLAPIHCVTSSKSKNSTKRFASTD